MIANENINFKVMAKSSKKNKKDVDFTIIKSTQLNTIFRLTNIIDGINSNKYFLVEFEENGVKYIGNRCLRLCIEKEKYTS